MIFIIDIQMLQTIRDSIFLALKNFSKPGAFSISANNIKIEKAKDQSHGDIATNAAMMFAKHLAISPKILAEAICAMLKKNDCIESVDIAGPGFVNMKLKNASWQVVINEILERNEQFSETKTHVNESLNLEFVSANPTGPLHTGHARNAVFGSVVANLLKKIGYDVVTEFYINDKGNQIKLLALSLHLRYREALGATISKDDFKEGMYCGEYLKEIAQNLVDIYKDAFLNQSPSEWLEFFSKFVVQKMLENIKKDLGLIGVSIDTYSSEAEIFNKKIIFEALAILSQKDDIYEGFIPKPKGGGENNEWEDRPQTLFRATKYGDDIDRPLKKSDGTWTYFAGDIAYHFDKIKRGFSKMISIFGADHIGYVTRLKSAVSALSDNESKIEIILYQLVNFLENGEQIKMSKRAGNFIALKDVVEKVGKDVARYMMISRHHDVMIDFDFVKAIECSMDNPLFYIQYAYARISSVFRNYALLRPDFSKAELSSCSKSNLDDASEIALMRSLSFWPEYVASAAESIEPHRIPIYLQEIAHQFHSLWNKGKLNAQLRFIDANNNELTLSRLALLEATRLVLADGLKIIGINPIEEMK